MRACDLSDLEASVLDFPAPILLYVVLSLFHCYIFPHIVCCPCHPQDDDPYVRKTAAVSVAKLYDINGPLVEEQGFLELLKDLISDSNPMVVANAVAAIAEIRESSPAARESLVFSHGTINKLLTALNECTE